MGICQTKSRVSTKDDPPVVDDKNDDPKKDSKDNGSIKAQELSENKLYPSLPNVPVTNSLVYSTKDIEKTSEEGNKFDEENKAGRINVKESEVLDQEHGAYKYTIVTSLSDTLTTRTDGVDHFNSTNTGHNKEPETPSTQSNEQNSLVNEDVEHVNGDSYELTKNQENPSPQRINQKGSLTDGTIIDDENTKTDELKSIRGKPRSKYNTKNEFSNEETAGKINSEQSNEPPSGLINNNQLKKGETDKKTKKTKSRWGSKDEKSKGQKRGSDYEDYKKDPKQKRIEKLEIRVQELEAEKEELLMRLSRAAGAALCLNNPDIADLSDMNRPTRIQERYSELYDNEWTDAFDSLRSLYSDEETIGLLLKLLVVVFKVCQRIATEQLDTLNVFGAEENIPKATLKLLTDNRKKNYKKYLKSLNPHIIEQIDQEFTVVEDKKIIMPYLKTCRELCWLMVIQDPPMALDTHIDRQGDPFDKSMFKEYTESGQRISYVVWPPLYLYENGPLMMKGVAQGDNTL